jgi:lactobin A/cerein 7B family class IIb bacteriocin
MTMAMTTTMNAPTTVGAVRTLRDDELDEVAGGMGNIAAGAVSGVVGGAFAGATYARNAAVNGGYTTSGMVGAVASGVATGFLSGTGLGLIASSIAGTAKGAHVLGVSMVGAGGALQVATGGGSD